MKRTIFLLTFLLTVMAVPRIFFPLNSVRNIKLECNAHITWCDEC